MTLSISLREDVLARGAGSREHDTTCMILGGHDGLDLLHRLSTNDLLSGGTPRAVRTLLCTEKGRLIAEIEVVVYERETILCLASAAVENVSTWVDKFTITEDVRLTAVTSSPAVFWVVGDKVISRLMRDVPGIHAPGVGRPFVNSEGISIWPSDRGSIQGVRILVRGGGESVLEGIVGSGEMRWLSAEESTLLRILEGVPEHGREITTDFNPLEVGLADEVSFTKGCYVGQEVIARLDAYAKVQRACVGLRLDAARVPQTAHLERAEIVLRDEGIGRLTSLSDLLDDGSRRGLGIVKKGTLMAGDVVKIDAGSGHALEAEIVALPMRIGRERTGEGR